MTVKSTTQRNDYTGNGSTNVYSFTFRVTEASDIGVKVCNPTVSPPVEYPLTLNTDYTLPTTAINAAAGGAITLVNASQAWLTGGNLTTGWTIMITRVPVLEQLTSLRDMASFYPSNLEDALDYIVMMAQRFEDQIRHAPKFRETSTAFDDFLITDPQPSCFLYTDPTGTKILFTAGQPASITIYTPPTNGFSSDVLVQAVLDKLNPRIHGTRAAPIAITAAANAISTDSGVFAQTWYVKGNGAPVDLTGQTPPIKAGTIVGQRLRLVGSDVTNTLTLPDDPVNGIVTDGPRVLGDGTIIDFEWNGTHWCEAAFNNL